MTSAALGLAAGGVALAVGAPTAAVLVAVVVVLVASFVGGRSRRPGLAVATAGAALAVLLLSCAVTLTWAFGCGDDVAREPGSASADHCAWLNSQDQAGQWLLLAVLAAAPLVTLTAGVLALRRGRPVLLAAGTAVGAAAVLAIGLPFRLG
ncbi:MAG TPA: hypothetical protein VN238_13255 [Solirubrobacteraceae bacterium]|nr:hypothetical protein [Solirubrobacteraceae bacterium]